MSKDYIGPSLKETLFNCLTAQLNEYELLKSMYPGENEIIFNTSKGIEELQEFLNKPKELIPSHIDFVLNLINNDIKIEFNVNLPTLYPLVVPPDIYISCNYLNRKQQTKINSDISSFLKHIYVNEECLFTLISWLNDSFDDYTTSEVESQDQIQNKCNLSEEKIVRYWIYSHHIYNKKKRDEIVSKARNMALTGFCLSGKPGIICIEGSETCCKNWWKEIKSMSWQKIFIKKEEYLDKEDKPRNFERFEEIRTDMKSFSKLMNSLNLSETFNELFGLVSEEK